MSRHIPRTDSPLSFPRRCIHWGSWLPLSLCYHRILLRYNKTELRQRQSRLRPYLFAKCSPMRPCPTMTPSPLAPPAPGLLLQCSPLPLRLLLPSPLPPRTPGGAHGLAFNRMLHPSLLPKIIIRKPTKSKCANPTKRRHAQKRTPQRPIMLNPPRKMLYCLDPRRF